MQDFALDPALLRHGSLLGRTPHCHVLVAHDAAVAWFMLVPETSEVELCDLPPALHAALFAEAHRLGRAVRERFAADKLNVAAIGNVVRQLHLHVIGRHRDDAYWPGVPWGRTATVIRDDADIAALRAWVGGVFGADFVPSA
ncbi:MAG: HIT family protein [Gammaproteobacteria bacterium]